MEFSQKSYRRWNTVLLLIIITGLSAADPNCAVTPVNDATSSLVCVGIDNTTLDLLTSQLDTLKASGLLINLELQLSDVNGLPSNFLTGYPIRSLTFFNDGLTDFPDGVLNNVDSPLVVLDLSFNAISDVKYEHFENLQFVPSLEILILSNNKLTALPNKNIFQMFPNLRRLILSFNNIDTLKSNSFADLSALTDLHLYANQIGKIEIDAFGTLPSLTRLYLNENNIDTLDDGTFSLDKFPALIRIYLGSK